MRRRKFITLLVSATFAGSPVARSQQPAKRPTIGYLGPATLDSQRLAAFVKRLRDLGWIEGRTIAIEYRLGIDHCDPATADQHSFSQQRV